MSKLRIAFGFFKNDVQMKKGFQVILFGVLIFSNISVIKGQYLSASDSAFNAGIPMTGRLWGLVFGDYYYKTHADALNRGGGNQYSGIPKDRNAFQMRRIWLGYDYNFNKKFSAEILLAAEDNYPTGNPPTSSTTSGDELMNNKLAFYVKFANFRIKNLWRGTDLIIGQQSTPAFKPSSDRIWSYRSIEKTLVDMRRTPAYDFGAGLQGTFDPNAGNYGYNLLVANGSGAKPPTNSYKWIYGDIWAKFFSQKVIVDIFADYNKLNQSDSWHHSRQLIKGFIGYNTSPLTIGVEGFINHLKQDVFATRISDGGTDTLNSVASGASVFVHGDIVKGKLRIFARFDHYSPTNKINNDKYNKYVLNTTNFNDNSYSSVATSNTAAVATGDQTYTQNFVTFGLDYMPMKNIHIMPNIWYIRYATQLSDDLNNTVNRNLASYAKGDYDLVCRITFFYTFGK